MNTNVEYDASVLLILIGYGNVHNYVRMYPATITVMSTIITPKQRVSAVFGRQ